MLSVILGLFALPFGVIGRLWSVIVSVPGHPLLLDSSCKLFPCQILFSKKNKKEKKNVSIFHLLKNYQACGFMAFSTTMYIALIACLLRASFFGYTYLNASVKVFAKRGRGVGGARDYPREETALKYNCYPCYLCYLRVTKMHFWEKSNTFWTYMLLTTVNLCYSYKP